MVTIKTFGHFYEELDIKGREHKLYSVMKGARLLVEGEASPPIIGVVIRFQKSE